MKVYIVIDCCSGEDYSTNEPNILFVSSDYAEAKQFFMDEIDNWEDGMTNFDHDLDNSREEILTYECTDYEGDSHRIMKLVEKEI